MKKTATHLLLAFITGICVEAPICVSLADDNNPSSPDTTSTQSTAAPAPVVSAGPAPVISTSPAPVKLPYGVEDVLKLSRAQVSEEIVLTYVQNSGTIYNLTPKDIVYLRDQGVSDRVVGAMLDQRKRVELAAQNSAAQAGGVPAGTAAPYTQTAPDANNVSAAPNYTAPSGTYAEAPLTPPASSAYVIPYSPGYYAPYYYPYYYGGWWGPSVAFGFRFGGHGGFHGGRGFGGHGFGGGGHHR